MLEWIIFLIRLSAELSGFGWAFSLIDAVCLALIEAANSNFFTALIGAFAGAYGGQLIVERGKLRQDLLAEIRNTNAAIVLAISICNSALSLKAQHVRAMKQNYNDARAAFDEFKRGRDSGVIPKDRVHRFLADFQSLPRIETPIESLQAQVFEKISASGRIIILITTLKQTLASLTDSTEKRNDYIKEHKDKVSVGLTDTITPTQYFGLQDALGHQDTSYPSFIQGIYNFTDDSIYFSHLLVQELVDHATSLTKALGPHSPKIVEPSFQKAIEGGLMPDASEYLDWHAMFPKKSGGTKPVPASA